MQLLSWLQKPILNTETIQHLNQVQGANVILTKQIELDEERNPPLIFESIDTIITDGQREKFIGNFLPRLFDIFVSRDWIQIIHTTFKSHFEKNYTYNQNDIFQKLIKEDKNLLLAAKEFVLCTLRILRSNITLKQFMKSIPEFENKQALVRGFLYFDVLLGSKILGLGNLKDLFVFPPSFKERSDLHIRLGIKLGKSKSQSLRKSQYSQIKVLPAKAVFIPTDEMGAPQEVGGCIMQKISSKYLNIEIHSVLMHLRAIICQYEDMIEFNDPKALDYYLEQEKQQSQAVKFPILLELRMIHIKFYKSLKNLIKCLDLKVEGVDTYISDQIKKVEEYFPLPPRARLRQSLLNLKNFPQKRIEYWSKRLEAEVMIIPPPLNLEEITELLRDYKIYSSPIKQYKSAIKKIPESQEYNGLQKKVEPPLKKQKTISVDYCYNEYDQSQVMDFQLPSTKSIANRSLDFSHNEFTYIKHDILRATEKSHY